MSYFKPSFKPRRRDIYMSLRLYTYPDRADYIRLAYDMCLTRFDVFTFLPTGDQTGRWVSGTATTADGPQQHAVKGAVHEQRPEQPVQADRETEAGDALSRARYVVIPFENEDEELKVWWLWFGSRSICWRCVRPGRRKPVGAQGHLNRALRHDEGHVLRWLPREQCQNRKYLPISLCTTHHSFETAYIIQSQSIHHH